MGERLRLTGHLNEMQESLIQRTIQLANEGDFTDIIIRVDGRELRLDGEWIKQLMWLRNA